MAADIQNPYWDAASKLPRCNWQPRSVEQYNRDAMKCGDYTPWRTNLTQQYSWSLTSPESVAFVLEHLDGRPVVEVGAGTGYWAWLLTQSGIDVNAYDSDPPSEGWNHWHAPRSRVWYEYTEQDRTDYRRRNEELLRLQQDVVEATKDSENPFPALTIPLDLPEGDWSDRPTGKPGVEYVPVMKGGPEVLELPENRTRVLFLSWPPYDNDMGAEVVRAYQGDMIVYLGEMDGGCCGNDAMFKLLDEGWEEVAWCHEHFQWEGIHDQLVIFKRRGS